MTDLRQSAGVPGRDLPRRRASSGHLPALGVVDGGYPPTLWYSGDLALLGLLVLILVARRRCCRLCPARPRRARAVRRASPSGASLSIAWADDKGEAWDAANRTLLYLAVYGVFLLWPWRARHGACLLGAYALGVAAIAAATLVSLLRADDPYSFFIGGRYAEPVGYLNANCALFLSAFWPAVFLASRRETPWWLRGLFLRLGRLPARAGDPAAEPRLALRLPGRPGALPVLVPGRTRSLLVLGPAFAAAYLAAGRCWTSIRPGATRACRRARRRCPEPLDRLGRSRSSRSGTVYGLVDRFAPLPRGRRAARCLDRRRAPRGSWPSWPPSSSSPIYGSPVARAQDAWDEFSAGQQFEESSSYFGANLGSNRYDFWRVAVGRASGLAARRLGAGNFADGLPAGAARAPRSRSTRTACRDGRLADRDRRRAALRRLPRRRARRRLASRRSRRHLRSGRGRGRRGRRLRLLGAARLARLVLGVSGPRGAGVRLARARRRARPAGRRCRPERPGGWTRRRATAAALYTLAVVVAVVSLSLPVACGARGRARGRHVALRPRRARTRSSSARGRSTR